MTIMTHVFNDLHLGVKRSGGTTQASALALRHWLLNRFEALVQGVPNGHDIVINGDLFDQFDAPLEDVAVAYGVLRDFLDNNPGSELWICAGNHDLSKDSSKLGSVQFLAALLASSCHRAHLIQDRGMRASEGIYLIPHTANQALFDLELERVPEGTRYLLLHCNFNSPFAEHADHSLNLSMAQAQAFAERGITLVLGHEHHQRTLLGGRVIIPGNQFPTSIADCVTPWGREVEHKHYALIRGDDGVELIPTWAAQDQFRQVDVMAELDPAWSGFVRVTGSVAPEDSADALKKISRLRQTSNAFVITNAVKVRGSAGNEIEDAMDGVEDVRGIDVIGLLMETLNQEQQEAVRALLALR